MTPPGLGARLRLARRPGSARHEPALLLRLGATRVPARTKLDSAFTPAVSLVRALNVALGLLLEEGLEAAFDRHVRLGRACREGAKAMGLELFSPDEDRSAVVTAILTPEGVDAQRAAPRAARPLRRHRRRRPRRPEEPALPDRPHRLLRRLRHHDRARRRRARAGRAGRRHRARRGRDRGARGVRGARAACERRASSSASRSPRRASSCSASTSTSTSTATPTSPR